MDSSLSSSSQKDIELCHKYAGFADNLGRQHYDILYWLLFSLNLCLLFTSARTFIWAQEALARRSKGSLDNAHTTQKHLFVCIGFFFTSATIVILEVFILFGLQFCDGEVLMSLYWSSWTVLQIGSVIAIGGVVIALVHTRRGSAPPPWGLALGTPILVVAASYHILSDIFVDNLMFAFRKTRDGKVYNDSDGPLPLSQVNTIQVSEPSSPISTTLTIDNDATDDDDDDDAVTINDAEIIGFTLAGGPIVRLARPMASSQWGNPEMVAMTEGNRPLLVFGPNGLQVTRRGDDNIV